MVVSGCSKRQLREQPDEIAVWIDAIRLAGFDERVKIGAGLCTGNGICEQPAFAVHNEWPDRVFAELVGYGPVSVPDVADQFVPLPAHVLQRLAQ